MRSAIEFIGLSLRRNIVTVAITCLFLVLAACGDDDRSLAPHDEDSSSSVCEDCDDSSSSVKSSNSAKSSSSVTSKSSESAESSFSVTPKSSSSLSSSSEYVPFDHSKAFDGTLWRAGAYKTFIDTRNGREYYYLEMEANGKSLKVMAEWSRFRPGIHQEPSENRTKSDITFGGLWGRLPLTQIVWSGLRSGGLSGRQARSPKRKAGRSTFSA